MRMRMSNTGCECDVDVNVNGMRCKLDSDDEMMIAEGSQRAESKINSKKSLPNESD